MFWSALILTLKCMGRRRVGFCAGGRVVVAASDDKGRRDRRPPRLWKLRCSFVALGGSCLLLGAALVGPGLRAAGTASASVRRLNRSVQDLVTQGLLIRDVMARVRWNVDALDVDALLRETECPGVRNGTVWADHRLQASARGIEDEFASLEEYLESSDLEGMRRRIHDVLDGTDAVDVAVAAFDSNDWIVRMYALVLNVLVAFMIFAALAALCGGACRSLRAMSCMAESLLPFFVVLIAGSGLATSALALASIANAGKRRPRRPVLFLNARDST